ncbi:hypothetical protein KUCAC02_012373, partial [Chaenocephalus aceratus]
KSRGEGALTDTSAPITLAPEWTSISSEDSDFARLIHSSFSFPLTGRALCLLC